MRNFATGMAEVNCLSETRPVIGPSERRATASRQVRIFFRLSVVRLLMAMDSSPPRQLLCYLSYTAGKKLDKADPAYT